MPNHIVQSPKWGDFKTEYGTKAVRVGDLQYTLHKIPFTKFYYAYCPKVNPVTIEFEPLKASLKKNDCVAINFDVPNVIKGTPEETRALEIFKGHCVKSPRDQFATHNIVLDISLPEDDLLAKMHHKLRYNIRLAQKKGVSVGVFSYLQDSQDTKESFDTFFRLYKQTAERQKYYVHPKSYHQKMWEILGEAKMCHIITSFYQREPLASWMMFICEGVLYYPYGGSSIKHRDLHGSELVGWEAIKLGKEYGCHTFDMWGAITDLQNTNDSWWGFSNFKIKFGGRHVEYMDSYDFVVSKPVYRAFNLANDVRWRLLGLLK